MGMSAGSVAVESFFSMPV